jgi:hypothetical protein
MRLAAALAVLAAVLVAPSGASASRLCGHITLRSGGDVSEYRAYVIKGRVSCRRARGVLRARIARGHEARGWDCVRGSPLDLYDITCRSRSAAIGAERIREP